MVCGALRWLSLVGVFDVRAVRYPMRASWRLVFAQMLAGFVFLFSFRPCECACFNLLGRTLRTLPREEAFHCRRFDCLLTCTSPIGGYKGNKFPPAQALTLNVLSSVHAQLCDT
jgi:hypothetical protein